MTGGESRFKNMPAWRSGIAREYKVGANSLTHYRQQKLVGEFLGYASKESPIEDVLDCPCGSGRFFNLFDMCRIHAADSNPNRVKKIKERFEHVDVRMADIFDLPYEDESFDVVLTLLLLQHIKPDDYVALLKEISRVSRKWLIFTYSSDYSLSQLNRIVSGKGKGHRYTVSDRKMEELLDRAGLKLVRRKKVFPLLAAANLVLAKKM